MMWALYGLLHGIFRAAFAETNRIFRADGWYLTFWHAICGSIILLPFLPFMHWGGGEQFYIAAFTIGLVFAVGTVIMLTLAGERRGRVTGLYMPLEAAAALVLWGFVMPGVWEDFANSVPLSIGVVVSMLILSLAMMRVRPHDITLETFIIVAPIGLTYAISGVVIKMVVLESHFLPMALTFVWIMYATMAAALAIMLLLKRKVSQEMVSKKYLKAGFYTGLFGMLSYLTFVISIVKAPNPGYTSMLAMMLPVWLLLAHKMINLEDDTNSRASLFITFGVVLLIVAVSFFS